MNEGKDQTYIILMWALYDLGRVLWRGSLMIHSRLFLVEELTLVGCYIHYIFLGRVLTKEYGCVTNAAQNLPLRINAS